NKHTTAECKNNEGQPKAFVVFLFIQYHIKSTHTVNFLSVKINHRRRCKREDAHCTLGGGMNAM
ncbi:MAG: hypothetical protein IJC45_07970, partial [Clostridia bacterium]|nr:hypothetical protein [Clostridia bacterium]